MTMLASILLRQGRPKTATEILNRLIEKSGTDARDQVLNLRGRMKERSGKDDEALFDYSLALRSDPDNADVRISRGLLLIGSGERGPGLRDLTCAVLAIPPGHAGADDPQRP